MGKSNRSKPITQPAAPCVQQYVWALGLAALETAKNPKLLPVFVGLLKIATVTLLALDEAQRRLAA